MLSDSSRRVLVDAYLTPFRRPLDVLKVFWPMLASLGGAFALVYSEAYTSYFLLLVVLLLVAWFLTVASIVKWHRVIVLDERPSTPPLLLLRRNCRYWWRSFLVGITWALAFASPSMFGLYDLYSLYGACAATVVMALLQARWVLKLPMTALDAGEVTPMAPLEWRLVLAAAVFPLALLGELPTLLADVFGVDTSEPPWSAVQASWVVVALLLEAVVFATVLSLWYAKHLRNNENEPDSSDCTIT